MFPIDWPGILKRKEKIIIWATQKNYMSPYSQSGRKYKGVLFIIIHVVILWM
jgi:hypothetical protein